MLPLGIELATPCLPACSSNHSAIGTVNDMVLKLWKYFYATIQQYFCVLCKGYIDVTGGSSPQPSSLLRPATLVQIQGSTFNTGNKYECAKVNNLLWKQSADIYKYLHMPDCDKIIPNT